MPGFGQVLFHQHGVVAKAGQGLPFRRRQRVVEFAARPDLAHPLATAAGRGLEQHRVTHLLGRGPQDRRVLVIAVITRHQRHPGGFHNALGRRFRAHRLDRASGRADKHHALLRAGPGKTRILRQEAVARVNGLGAGGCCRRQDTIPQQVGFPRRRGADMNRLVRHAHMQRLPVRIGIHRHRGNAHAPGGLDDAAGDLAAVGNQNFIEHGYLSFPYPYRGLGRDRSRAFYNEFAPPSHPEHAKLRLFNRCIQRRRNRQAQHHAGIRRVDDAVVPQPR